MKENTENLAVYNRQANTVTFSPGSAALQPQGTNSNGEKITGWFVWMQDQEQPKLGTKVAVWINIVPLTDQPNVYQTTSGNNFKALDPRSP